MTNMRGYRTMCRQLTVSGLVMVLFWGLGISSVAAEGDAGKKGSGANSEKSTGQSNDPLQKQINDLDSQIQKLRDQSLELQEKTKAKLQNQLEILKQQRDALVPRIEKLRDNSEMAWQDIKENIQKAIEDLKASVETIDK